MGVNDAKKLCHIRELAIGKRELGKCIHSSCGIFLDWLGRVVSAESEYSGPCILRPPLQPDKFGLKLEVVLKWRDIYIENIRKVSLIASLKMEETVKWRGLKLQGPLY